MYELITVSAVSGLTFDRSWNYPNYVVISIASGGGANTGIRPRLVFDPATNAITSVINQSNGAALTLAPGSKYNAATKTIDVGWVSGRWTVNEQWKYIGPR